MLLKVSKFAAILLAITALAACESMSGSKEGEVDSSATTTPPATDSTTMGVSTGTGFQGNPLDDPASLLSNRAVYFEYNSSEILGPDRPVIEAHGRYLADNASASMTLEGHADERGSREYNIALGEQRANAVRQLMSLLGASASQIKVVSYGEERPAADGHSEAAWRLNRRVEIIHSSR
jgi:peptidoglycan-associated lipoprotein